MAPFCGRTPDPVSFDPLDDPVAERLDPAQGPAEDSLVRAPGGDIWDRPGQMILALAHSR